MVKTADPRRKIKFCEYDPCFQPSLSSIIKLRRKSSYIDIVMKDIERKTYKIFKKILPLCIFLPSVDTVIDVFGA